MDERCNNGLCERVRGHSGPCGTDPSPRRFVLLGGPGGYLTVRPAGCPMTADRYRGWVELLHFNAPRGRWFAPVACADAAKYWALRTFEVV